MAKERLEIVLPVVIRQIPYRGRNQAGFYQFIDNKHIISIINDRFLSQVNDSLWHELAHASQTERFLAEGNHPADFFFTDIYKQYVGNLGAEYINNKFEIEARNIAKDYSHVILVEAVSDDY